MKIVNAKTIGGINQYTYGRIGLEDFLLKTKRFLLFVSHKISSFSTIGKHLIAKQSAFVKISCILTLVKKYLNAKYNDTSSALKTMNNSTLQIESFKFGMLRTHQGIHYVLKSNFHFKRDIYSNIY